MPHDVPEIGDRPTAKCIEAGEGCKEKILSVLIQFFEKIRHEKAGKSAAKDRQKCNTVTDVFRREKEGQKVQRAGAVVRKDRPEIRSASDIPREEQAFSVKDLIPKFEKERCVLVIAVHRQDHILAGCKRMHL